MQPLLFLFIELNQKKTDSTGAPARGRRGRAGRPVFDDDEEEEGISASEYDDDDDDIDGLRPRASSSPKKTKSVSSKKTEKKKKPSLNFGDEDSDDDEDDIDDEEEILDEASALAAATLAARGDGDGDDDEVAADGGSDPLLADAAVVAAAAGDGDDDDGDGLAYDDDLAGLLDAAAALSSSSSSSSAAAAPSSPAAVARAGGGATRRRRPSSAAAAANTDPLSAVVGLPEGVDDGHLYDGDGAEEGAGGGVGDGEGLPEDLPAIEYPEPPHRERALGQLLASAGVEVASSLLAPSSSSSLDGIVVTGVEDEVSLLAPGDLFATQAAAAAKTSPAALARELSRAAASGAVAALVPESYEGALGALYGGDSSSSSASSALPLPVIFVAAASPALRSSTRSSSSMSSPSSSPSSPPSSNGGNSDNYNNNNNDNNNNRDNYSNNNNNNDSIARAAGAVARDFYDDPTARMSTVLFVGGPGKTTSAWLTRGILEEAGALAGMLGSIEYALHADRLDARGALWVADEDDPTASRECSAAFHLAPYRGKYPHPAPNSTALRVHKIAAGMADRGATAAVLELSAQALVAGAAEGVDVDVAVFTGTPMKSTAAGDAKAAVAAASAASKALSSSSSSPSAAAAAGAAAAAAGAAAAAAGAAAAAAGAEALVKAEGSAELDAIAAVFESLTDPDRQRAILNADDPNFERIRSAVERGGAPAISFAVYNGGAEVSCNRVQFGLWETELLVSTPIGALSLSTMLVCRHNVFNVLSSVAAGLAVTIPSSPSSPGGEETEEEEEEGEDEEAAEARSDRRAGGRALDLRTIVWGIEATEVVPGRTEGIDEGQPFAVIVDAARTPDALGRLLDGVREAGAKRLILVMGCEGGRPKAPRPYMGEVAHYKAHIVIVTSDNPRGEDPREIVADVVSGFPDEILAHNARVPYRPGFLQDPGRVTPSELEFLWDACYDHVRYVCEDRWMAIRWAIGTAAADDAVLIVGKGCEDFQEWIRPGKDGETVRGWFDDRVEARNALVRAADLWSVAALDRSELPWMEWDEREARLGA